MSYYYDYQSETDWLENIASKCKSELPSLPEGRIRVIRKGKYSQYYYVTDDTNKNGNYINSSNLDLIKKLVRKEYLKKVLVLAKKRLQLLHRLEEMKKLPSIESVYSGLNSEKRKLLSHPFAVDSDTFAERWINEEYKQNPYPFNDAEYFTTNHDRVRSKTEMIIADTLNMYGIPYKYEKQFILESGNTLYPDFTILNKRTGQEYILEHFGMMDNEEYRLKAFEKIELYKTVFGPRFICLFEEYRRPFRRAYLEQIIKDCFL